MNTEQISRALRPINMAPASEAELHLKMEQCFDAAGILFEREVGTVTGPVDFVIGTIAVEVKVKGSALAVARQITRYLQDDRFGSAILITTRPISLPISSVEAGGAVKQIEVINLWKNFL